MTEVAGEVCDGFLCHGFTTERYLREVTLPAPRAGPRRRPARRSTASRSRGPTFVVTGRDEEEMAKAATGARQQIAFYGSTPAYRGVLDLHGWGELQDELNGLSKQGEWKEMGDLIDDEMLDDVRRGRPEPTRSPARCRPATATCSTASASTRPTRPTPTSWASVIADLKAA